MLKILRAYGITVQIVDVIGNMHERSMAKVIYPDGETELFEKLVRLLQEDTLAPYLFVIVLDFALRMVIDEGKKYLVFI